MGSEAPPQPAAADQPPDVEAQPAVEEERIRHAFGRDTDTALPPDGGRAGPDKTTAETPVTPAPAPPRRSGGMSAIAAGIIGGVITLLGAGGLQYAGLLPSPATTETVPAADTQALAALQAEIAALKQDVAAVKAGSGGDTTALTQSVTELSTGLQGLGGALDQVKADVAALKSAVESGSAGDGAAVQALSSKLAELQAAVAALGTGRPRRFAAGARCRQPEDRRNRRGGSGRRRDRKGRRRPACGARTKRRRPCRTRSPSRRRSRRSRWPSPRRR